MATENEKPADHKAETTVHEANKTNAYLTDSLGRVFMKMAAPIIFMMLVNGSFNLVDAYFLGVLVGANALAAVTAMFPATMLLIALSTLVSNGFASVMARLLGAGKVGEAANAFAQAITLSLIVCGALIVLFIVTGHKVAMMANNNVIELATMSHAYMAIIILCSPLQFMLSINGDSLRCEGHVGFMAITSLASVLLNGLFNYVFIAHLNMGVAGSAYGTVTAQALVILAIFLFRRAKQTDLKVQVIKLSPKRNHWGKFLALGLPSSLNYAGIALMSTAILFNLQHWDSADYNTTVSAYGIVTRLTTFIYLPLLGLSMAFQSIVGNNVGAKNWARSNSSIRIALLSAFVYCAVIQVLVWLLKNNIGSWFVESPAVIKEVAHILPISTMTLVLLGPTLMLSMFFQSIGDVARAGLLGLAKTYLFALPLVFLLPLRFAEVGIWFASPIADICVFVVALLVLNQRRRHQYRFGLFYPTNQ